MSFPWELINPLKRGSPCGNMRLRLTKAYSIHAKTDWGDRRTYKQSRAHEIGYICLFVGLWVNRGQSTTHGEGSLSVGQIARHNYPTRMKMFRDTRAPPQPCGEGRVILKEPCNLHEWE